MQALAERLRSHILAEGPIPFREWMQACLYGPDGYYVRAKAKTGPGPEADFATSPTLHPFFGQAVAKEAVAAWARLGRPPAFQAVEFGGGEGHLARHALAWLDGAEPGLAKAIQWVHVEASPFHRARQGEGGDGDPRLRWAAEMPAAPAGFVVANEFLDALPFDWLEWDGSGWQEVAVGWGEGGFQESRRKPPTSVLASAPAGRFRPGQRVVAMPHAHAWLQSVGLKLGRGTVLVADYGDRGSRLWTPDRMDGTVRAFRAHRMAESVLEAPGEQDITASVDFTLAAAWAQAAGLRETSFETQEAFLLRHGVLEAINAVERTTRAGASDYLRLRQLLLPSGLGTAFKVQRLEK